MVFFVENWYIYIYDIFFYIQILFDLDSGPVPPPTKKVCIHSRSYIFNMVVRWMERSFYVLILNNRKYYCKLFSFQIIFFGKFVFATLAFVNNIKNILFALNSAYFSAYFVVEDWLQLKILVCHQCKKEKRVQQK